MARNTLARLTPNDINYTPEPPVFVNLTAGILSQADGDLAGADTGLLQLGLDIGSEPNEGSALDSALASADFQAGAIGATVYAPVAMDYNALTPGGDAALSDYTTGVGGTGPGGGPGPSPPAPTPPGSGGSAPTTPACAPIIGQQGPCTFTQAELASFINFYHFNAVHQGCGGGQYVLTFNSRQFFTSPYVALSVFLVSGDGNVLQVTQTHDLAITPQGTVTLTFSTQNLGAWQFVVSGTFAYTSAQPRVGVCFQVVP